MIDEEKIPSCSNSALITKKNHLRLFFVHPSLVYWFLMTSVKKGEKLVKLTWAKKSKAMVVKIPTKYGSDGHVCIFLFLIIFN